MQPGTCVLSAFALTTATAFWVTAMAADLPKEGTFSGTYAGSGMCKINPVGKERTVLACDELSLTVGKGFLDHMTWHCLVLDSVMTGMGHFEGYCVVTDPAGDQIAADIASDGTFPADAKTVPAKGTFTTGTGKYAGISGSLTNILHHPDFRTAAEGTYVQYGELQAKYKLP
jgi:hypothetical protein